MSFLIATGAAAALLVRKALSLIDTGQTYSIIHASHNINLTCSSITLDIGEIIYFARISQLTYKTTDRDTPTVSLACFTFSSKQHSKLHGAGRIRVGYFPYFPCSLAWERPRKDSHYFSIKIRLMGRADCQVIYKEYFLTSQFDR